MDINKLNFLDITKKELKSAVYVMAAGQLVKITKKTLTKVLANSKNEKVRKFSETGVGTAVVSFAIAEGGKKIPVVGENQTFQYIASGLRVGGIIALGSSLINSIFSRKKNEEK